MCKHLIYPNQRSKFFRKNSVKHINQVSLNIRSLLISNFTVKYFARKQDSNLASEMDIVRIIEQIDALEVTGINSADLLIFPKITGFIIPVLVIFRMGSCIEGSYYINLYINICFFKTSVIRKAHNKIHKSFGDKFVIRNISAVLDSDKINLIIGHSDFVNTILLKNDKSTVVR